MTQHIVSVSSGLGSAFTWKLMCDKYGRENVTGVFTDVNGEHSDNYRFLAEVQYLLGSRLVKITNNGKTIWDVMVEQRYLSNSRIDSCSKYLKRVPFQAWLRENCNPADTTVYLGIDWMEAHRLDRAKPRWAQQGWNMEAPLCEPPYYAKEDAQAWLDEAGIKRPALYDMGFGHANCGGGCVKAGIGQFKQLLEVDRNWYVNWWEAGEERVRQTIGKDVAILRDRRGGKTKPLTLRKLRETVEVKPDEFDNEPGESGCGVCFLAGDDSQELTERKMAEVSITLKGGPEYDAPWIVIKGETVGEVGDTLKNIRDHGILSRVQAAGLEFQARKEDGVAVRAIQQANPGAEVVQELPEDMKPKCPHGTMVHKAQYSTKQKRNYDGYFCPNDDKDCKPQQFRWTS